MNDSARLADLQYLQIARRWAKTGVARLIRERADVTQAELAEACGVDPSTVGLWETGQRSPSGDRVVKYAEALRALAINLPGGISAIEAEVAAGEAAGTS